jgi:predicted nucleic acid-binding protein
MTLTDTGPLVALIDKGDAGHTACKIVLPRLSPPLITTWPCMTEAMYLLGKVGGYTFQQALWRLRVAGHRWI